MPGRTDLTRLQWEMWLSGQGLNPADISEEGANHIDLPWFLSMPLFCCPSCGCRPVRQFPLCHGNECAEREHNFRHHQLRGMKDTENTSSKQKRLGVANLPKDSRLAGDG